MRRSERGRDDAIKKQSEPATRRDHRDPGRRPRAIRARRVSPSCMRTIAMIRSRASRSMRPRDASRASRCPRRGV